MKLSHLSFAIEIAKIDANAIKARRLTKQGIHCKTN
jgi:hypothetical protein